MAHTTVHGCVEVVSLGCVMSSESEEHCGSRHIRRLLGVLRGVFGSAGQPFYALDAIGWIGC
jgi:hypothetical protein